MPNFERDDNRVAVLGGVTDNAAADATAVLIDPSTGRLKVSAIISTNLDDLNDIVLTGTATGDILYLSSTAWVNLPAGTADFVLTANGAATAPSWKAAAGGTAGTAPETAQYVVLATDATLDNERVLIGTSNRITITDGGAGGNVTLNTPQDIGTTATVTFGTLTITNGVIAGTAQLTSALAIASGGTGANTAANARTNLGLAIGTDIQAYDAQLADVAGLSPTGSAFIGSNATNFILRTAAQTRGDLSLVVGTDVQAYDAQLADVAGLTPTGSTFIVGNGSNFISHGTTAVHGDLGLGSMATAQASNVTITGGSITGITDLAVGDGGTGASTAGGARTNLGLVIGTNVQAWDNDLDDIAALTHSGTAFMISNGTDWIAQGTAAARNSMDAANRHFAISEQNTSTSYVLVLEDDGALVQVGTANTYRITIPANASVAFPVGTRVGIRQSGIGTVLVGTAAAVTVQSQGTAYITGGQYAMAMLFKIDTNTWALEGNLT